MLLGLSLIILLWQSVCIAEPLPRRLAIVAEGHQLPEASYGFLVQEIGKQEPLLSVNANTAFNPASSVKIITTLAALEELGPA